MGFIFIRRVQYAAMALVAGVLSSVTVCHAQALENADIGPFLANTIEGPDGNTAYKGVVIKLGKGDAAVCFDTDLLRYMAGWVRGGDAAPVEAEKPEAAGGKPPKAKPAQSAWTAGEWAGLVDPNKSTAFTASHGGPPRVRSFDSVRFATRVGPGWSGPQGEMDFTDPRKPPVADPSAHLGPLPKGWAHYKGLYRHGQDVVLAYTVAGADVLELPGWVGTGEHLAFTRTIRIGKTNHPLSMVVCDVNASVPGHAEGKSVHVDAKSRRGETQTCVALIETPPGASLARIDGRVMLHLPAQADSSLARLVIWSGPKRRAGRL